MLSRPTPAPARVTHAGKERRSTLRLRCSGSAEFRVEGSEVRIWGTLYDVSLHGCYIEMNNTFPVDTRVNLVLEAMGIRVQMLAVVRVSYPFLGMGLCFSEIDPGQQLQLEQMLAAVSASATTSSPDPSLSPTATSTRSLADVEPGRPARQTQRVLLRQCPALAAGVLRVRQAIASLTFPLRSKLSGGGRYATFGLACLLFLLLLIPVCGKVFVTASWTGGSGTQTASGIVSIVQLTIVSNTGCRLR